MLYDTHSGRPRSPSAGPPILFRFADFQLDSANRLLTRDGQAIPLPARAFDCLVTLLERSGQLVHKDELLNTVWANAFVEESNLAVAISTLRRALGEDRREPRFIQTVSGRGYRFIGEVEIVPVAMQTKEPPAERLPDPTRPDPDVSAGSVATAELQPQNSPAPKNLLAGQDSWGQSPPESGTASTTPRVRPEARVGWLTWLLVAAALCAGCVIAWRLIRADRLPLHSLLVLPVQGNGADEDVRLGMTDSLISRLEASVKVPPTSSVLRYAGGSMDAVSAAREQGADAVLISDLAQSPRGLTLSMEMRSVATGRARWHESFTGHNLATLQQQAEAGLMDWLRSKGVSPTLSGKGPASRIPADNGAYQMYLRGRYFWNRRTDDSLYRSIECFRQSIAIDPNYAPAYAGLADSYALLASFSVESGRNANADARAAALSAIQLDPTLAEPHASLGMIYFFTDWDGRAAETEFERAIALNPNYATAHHWYALDLAAMGRFPEAVYEIHRAEALDPLSMIIGTNVGWIEYLNHSYDAAMQQYHKVLDMDPSFVRARTRMGIVDLRTGRAAAAVADLTEAEKLSSDPYILGLLGQALAKDGQRAKAEHVLKQLTERAKTKYVPPFAIALVELGLGNRQEAIDWLGRAVDDRSTSMVYARIDPSLDELRGDPRFQKLIGTMKF